MTSAATTQLSEAAMLYAKLGVPVFRVGADKKPLAGSNGFYDATTDVATIEKWWAEKPEANIAIPTGNVSGIVVIDFDCKKGMPGMEKLKEWELEHGPLKTRTQHTPSGGVQKLYEMPQHNIRNSASLLAKGVDVRGNGGYICTAPSVVNGNSYYYDDPFAPIEPLPDWLLSLLLTKEQEKPSVDTNLDGEPIYDGQRDWELYRIGCSLRSQGWSYDEIEAHLEMVNAKRCIPPIEEWQVHEKAKQACKHKKGNQRSSGELWLAEQMANDPSWLPEYYRAQVQAEQPIPKTKFKPVLMWACEVKAEEVSWVWHPYMPAGRITMLDGDPGLGKSFLMLAVAAKLTNGELMYDNGHPKPRNVIYMSAEDSTGLLKSRFERLHGDATRLCFLPFASDGKLEKCIDLRDIDLLEEVITEVNPALIVVDPIQAYIGADVDIHRTNTVRQVMHGLSRLAEKHDAAIVPLRHRTKANQNRSGLSGIGSIDFNAAARSVLLVGADPDNKDERVMIHTKSSYARLGEPQGFSITADEYGKPDFKWTGVSKLTEASIDAKEEEPNKLEEAVEFLKVELASGAKESIKVKKAATKAGISDGTLHRAKRKLGITAVCEDTATSTWSWKLP